MTDEVDSKGLEDPWESLARHRETLEMCVEENTPFADRARKLLEKLDAKNH